jgi:hypothetical protein
MNILNVLMKKILLAAGTDIYVKVLDRLETGLKKKAGKSVFGYQMQGSGTSQTGSGV